MLKEYRQSYLRPAAARFDRREWWAVATDRCEKVEEEVRGVGWHAGRSRLSDARAWAQLRVQGYFTSPLSSSNGLAGLRGHCSLCHLGVPETAEHLLEHCEALASRKASQDLRRRCSRHGLVIASGGGFSKTLLRLCPSASMVGCVAKIGCLARACRRAAQQVGREEVSGQRADSSDGESDSCSTEMSDDDLECPVAQDQK